MLALETRPGHRIRRPLAAGEEARRVLEGGTHGAPAARAKPGEIHRHRMAIGRERGRRRQRRRRRHLNGPWSGGDGGHASGPPGTNNDWRKVTFSEGTAPQRRRASRVPYHNAFTYTC